MDIHNEEVMIKLASMEKGASNVNRLIVDNLRNYSDLNEAVQEFLADPGEEKAIVLDQRFAACEHAFEAIRAAVGHVAMVAIGGEENYEELAGVEEEDGLRLM